MKKELGPEFIKEMKNIEKNEKPHHVDNIDDLFELDEEIQKYEKEVMNLLINMSTITEYILINRSEFPDYMVSISECYNGKFNGKYKDIVKKYLKKLLSEDNEEKHKER